MSLFVFRMIGFKNKQGKFDIGLRLKKEEG